MALVKFRLWPDLSLCDVCALPTSTSAIRLTFFLVFGHGKLLRRCEACTFWRCCPDSLSRQRSLGGRTWRRLGREGSGSIESPFLQQLEETLREVTYRQHPSVRSQERSHSHIKHHLLLSFPPDRKGTMIGGLCGMQILKSESNVADLVSE